MDSNGNTHLQPCQSLPIGTTLDSSSIWGESYRSIRRWEAQLHAKILAETEVEEFRVILPI